MKCQIMECTNEAKGTYPACSEAHGTTLRMRKDNIKDSFDADLSRRLSGRQLYTVEEAEYYLK